MVKNEFIFLCQFYDSKFFIPIFFMKQMPAIKFTKMQGIGNDYIYINCLDMVVANPEQLSVKMSNRHFGVGADGLVLIMPSDNCDFRMRMFNADGSEAEMCGNASRCIGKFVYEKGLTKKTDLTLETKSGVKQLHLQVENEKVISVTVNMGSPILNSSLIPAIFDKERIISEPLCIEDKMFYMTCVSMGNPHCVLFVDDLNAIDIAYYGSRIENCPLFPERVNVEFVQVLSDNTFKMRVWERGSGETLACGTGACAVVVAGVLNNLCSPRSVVHLLGGDLSISWDIETNNLFLTGSAAFVFEGEYGSKN
jgi:diaminopimelate epimerase